MYYMTSLLQNRRPIYCACRESLSSKSPGGRLTSLLQHSMPIYCACRESLSSESPSGELTSLLQYSWSLYSASRESLWSESSPPPVEGFPGNTWERRVMGCILGCLCRHCLSPLPCRPLHYSCLGMIFISPSRMCPYPWPGNMAVIITRIDVITSWC